MKKLDLVLFVTLLFSVGSLYAQRTCNHSHHMEQLLQNPEYAQEHNERQQRFNAIYDVASLEERAQCSNPVTLPMAVHFQGVSGASTACLIALAESQIQVLNDDYAGTNSDISTWNSSASSFFPGVSNGETCINFCLATSNHPSGYGLTEGQPAVTVNATSGDFNSDFSGYINIWVRANTGVLGYSPLGGSGNGDGVVIDANAFGSGNGCGSISPGAPYNLGRTLTHELGHYLNLDHIWGNGCNVDDGVADTPSQSSSNGGCPSFGIQSCNTNDMHMNYMDYTNDACMYMFSAGQSTRMENYVAANLQNVANNAANVCAPATPGCNDGIQNGNETGVDCGGPDCDACPTCSDGIQNGDETGVDCGGSSCDACPAAPCTSFGSAFWYWDTNLEATIPTSCGQANASQSPYEAWTNEGIAIEDVSANQTYNFNFCNGYNPSTWEGSITVYGISGNPTDGWTAEQLLAFETGCSVTFNTGIYTNVYAYVNDVANACDATPNETDNGIYELYCVDTIPAGCTPPANYAVDPSTTSATFTWDAVSGATLYQVKYRLKGTTAWLTQGSTSLQRTISGLTAKKYYQYKLRAQCDSEWSDFTDIGLFYTSACDMPTGVSVSFSDDTRMRVRWDANPDEIKGKIRYRAVGITNWITQNSQDGNNFLWVNNLPAGATIQYKVRSNCEGNDWSEYSPLYTHNLSTSARTPLADMVKLYPNPAKEVLNVQLSGIGDAQISISDVSGRLVLDRNVTINDNGQTETLDISKLVEGYHILTVKTNEGIISKKFVVVK